ncbi:MAG: hypothetical protein IIB87_08170, partial [Chloroflexi bacterium]|nr:hypothetical protein [Chloroflexota bacterium]
SHGVRLAVVLLEPRTYGGNANALPVFGALAAAQIATFLVKRGDDLAKTLSVTTDAGRFAGRRP